MLVLESSDVNIEVVPLMLLVVIGLYIQTVLPSDLTYEVQHTCLAVSEHPQRRPGAYFHQQP